MKLLLRYSFIGWVDQTQFLLCCYLWWRGSIIWCIFFPTQWEVWGVMLSNIIVKVKSTMEIIRQSMKLICYPWLLHSSLYLISVGSDIHSGKEWCYYLLFWCPTKYCRRLYYRPDACSLIHSPLISLILIFAMRVIPQCWTYTARIPAFGRFYILKPHLT